MNDLQKYLIDHIQAHGPIDVGQFMSMALGHPEFGYYMKKDPFGRGGDFTTAPEVSQMFGEMIGVWCADVWMQMGSPKKFSLLECGPGRGTLMADIMRATKGVDGFHKAAHVHLLEISPVLKAIQKQTLCHAREGGHPDNKEGQTPACAGVTWHESLETVPDNQPIIIVANEFLDALPFRQFVKLKSGWAERVVTQDFKFGLKPAANAFIPKEFQNAKEGVIYESAPARIAFVKNISELLKKNTGAALMIDYGHEKSGLGDTFQAIYKHKYTDVLEHIGDADLTSHVDFEALKQAADVNVHGPVEQGAFLKDMGIEIRAEILASRADPAEILNALKRLSDSGQMGSLFKVMGLSYGQAVTPSGF
jgi:NADH dehydrogenase [ubiquinone] 1 alpha subcomplex assembly factor 7